MNDAVRLRGAVELVLREDGGEVARTTHGNMVMLGGVSEIVFSILGESNRAPNYFALGTGTSAVANTQTALVTGSSPTWRAIAAKTKYTTYIASFETVYTTAQANGTWTEIGMFSGATSTPFTGVLFARALITLTKTSSQTLTVSWRVQVS